MGKGEKLFWNSERESFKLGIYKLKFRVLIVRGTKKGKQY